MIEEQAKVIAIDDNLITLESVVKSSCSGCQQIESCGSGQVAKAFPHKSVSYTLTSDLPVNVGDSVVIGLSEQILLSTAWRVYIWPLIGLILSSFLGQLLLDNNYLPHELFALLIGLLGGGIGYKLAQRQLKYSENCSKWTPSLIKVNAERIDTIEIID